MKDIDNIHILLYARSLPPLFFSLKHIAYHAFTHEILNRNKYFSNNVLQCAWIKPHSSIITNIENLTSNLRQSVEIYCGEKQKEEDNGNCNFFLRYTQTQK